RIHLPIELHRLVMLAVAQQLEQLGRIAAEDLVAAGARPLLAEQLDGYREIRLHRIRIENVLVLDLPPEIVMAGDVFVLEQAANEICELRRLEHYRRRIAARMKALEVPMRL